MQQIKFKHKIYTKQQIKKRLLSYYKLAEQNEIENHWYFTANEFACKLAQKHSLKTFQVCGVIAALSPQKNWQANKRLATEFLRGKRHSQTAQQLNKAELCLTAKENEIFALLTKTGLKTSYFYNNILFPFIDSGVTIDRHAIGACVVSIKNIQKFTGDFKLTKTQYDFFAECYSEIAEQKNILPLQLQSTIWQTYRRLKELPLKYQTIPF